MRIPFLCTLVFVTYSFTQDVKVGYDKSVDFAKYKTYAWADLGRPTARPLLYGLIVTTIDGQMKEKGFSEVEPAAADLLLFPAGSVDSTFSMNAGAPVGNYLTGPVSVASASWIGPMNMANEGLSPIVHEGTLAISFVDRQSGALVWEGRVSDKFGNDKKSETITRTEKCVVKLLKRFPPEAKKD